MTAPEPMSERDALLSVFQSVGRLHATAFSVMRAEDLVDAILAAGFSRPVAATGVTEALDANRYRMGERIGSKAPCIMGEYEEPPHAECGAPHVRSRVLCTLHGDDLLPLGHALVAYLNGAALKAAAGREGA